MNRKYSQNEKSDNNFYKIENKKNIISVYIVQT